MTFATPFAVLGAFCLGAAIISALDHFSTADRTIYEEPGGQYARTKLKDIMKLAAFAVASFVIAALIKWMAP